MESDILLLVVGLTFLWFGAELLVKYASRLAHLSGVSPLVVGLTVVSLGTSLPELVVSLVAAIRGDMGISIGNIIGSNIANTGLILGVGAVIVPLGIRRSWIRREVPYMLLVTGIFYFFTWTGQAITRPEGLVLLMLLFGFLGYVGRDTLQDMEEFRELQEQAAEEPATATLRQKLIYLSLAGVGIVVLLGGSHMAVDNGTRLAERLGVSQSIIGLTLIALGTSLPELATTIVSATRNAVDLAVGNIIGSNIFNLALIGGVTSVIREIPVHQEAKLLAVEMPLLCVLSLLLLPMMRIGYRIRRREGVVLLLIYATFLYLTVVL